MAGRRFVYYCAVSADGFIARQDGKVDWLEGNAPGDYGFDAFLAGVDTIVWGRTTYEGYGMAPPGLAPFGAATRHIVMTRRPPPRGADPRVEFTAEAPQALARRLRAEGGRDVWLMGGGVSAGAFLDAGEVDELFVHVIPVLLGDGIRLFTAAPTTQVIRLVEAKAFPDGVVRLHYSKARPAKIHDRKIASDDGSNAV